MESCSFAILRHCFDNILDSIALERYLGMIGAMRDTDTRKEEPIEVIDLRDRPDRRSWIVRHGLLMDGDSRGESTDLTNTSCLRDIGDDHTSVCRE